MPVPPLADMDDHETLEPDDPPPGWTEFQAARASFFARLAQLTEIAQLEAAFAAPAYERPGTIRGGTQG